MTLSVQQTYSNGFKTKRQPIPAEITLNNLKVAKIQGDGTLKVTGMGTTKVTFTMENLTSSIQLDAGVSKSLQELAIKRDHIFAGAVSI